MSPPVVTVGRPHHPAGLPPAARPAGCTPPAARPAGRIPTNPATRPAIRPPGRLPTGSRPANSSQLGTLKASASLEACAGGLHTGGFCFTGGLCRKLVHATIMPAEPSQVVPAGRNSTGHDSQPTLRRHARRPCLLLDFSAEYLKPRHRMPERSPRTLDR